MNDIRKDWVEVNPPPNGEWLKVYIRKNNICLKYKFSHARNEEIKRIGFTYRNYPGWHGPVSKMLVRNFISTYPQSRDLFFMFPDWHELKNDFSSWTPSKYLLDHQKKSAILAKKYPRYGFFHDVGTGKTLLALELYKQKKVKTLVICPLSIIEEAWGEEIKEFAPEIPYCNLWSIVTDKSKKRKERKINKLVSDNCRLFIINYESFWRNLDFISSLGIEMMFLDESSMIKSHKTKVTKKVIQFADNLDYCYLFSGTPAPNREDEYWAQCRIIDPKVFGASYYAFKNKYFFEIGYGGFKLKMKEEMRELFLDNLSSITEVIGKYDVTDLPKQTFNIREVHLSEKEILAYKEMEKHLILDFEGHEVVAANQATKMMKLREGSSGFYYTEDMTDKIGLDGLFIIKKSIVVVGDSKLKELKLLLSEIGNHQVIIWIHFRYEGNVIEEMFQKQKSTYVRIDGTVKSPEETTRRIRQFKDQSVQYLIAHPKSIGHGQRLYMSNYAVYFSMSHSYELFKQSKDRQHRRKQVNPCSYYFLIAKKTLDKSIYKALMAKKSVTKAVFDYIKARGQNNGE